MWAVIGLAAVTLAASPDDSLERTSVDLRRTVWTDDTTSMHEGEGAVGVVALMDSDAMLTGHLTAGRLQIGAVLPLSRVTDGLGYATGDVRFTLARDPRSGLGLALGGRAWRPAGRELQGGGQEATVITELPIGPLAVLANGGVRHELGWTPVGRLGLVTPSDAKVGGAAEVALGGLVPEAMGSVWVRLGSLIGVRVGVASPLPGTVDGLRGMASIAMIPKNKKDLDADGITDRHDTCPWEAEDLDGYEDGDGCPDPVRLIVRAVDTHGREIRGAEWAADESWGHAPGGTLLNPGPVAVRAWAPRYEASTVVTDGQGGGTRTVEVVLMRQVGDIAVSAENLAGQTVEASWHVLRAPPSAADEPGELSVPGWYDIEVRAPGHVATIETVRVFRSGTTRLDVTLEEESTILVAIR
jgi:hypothetical protein